MQLVLFAQYYSTPHSFALIKHLVSSECVHEDKEHY